jgi:mono/diheme cytochrome c family protein
MKLFVFGIVTAVAVLVSAGVLAIIGGAYNVAADNPHTAIARWILRTAMTNSVKTHAGAIMPPGDFNAENRIRNGLHLFDEMCVQCHGAPGKKRGEVGMGLSPEPPDLARVARRWNPAQLFWVVKHGIIATGMPAFGGTHTDEQLWSLVAFVERLPDLSAEQYEALEHAGGESHDHEGNHTHDHHHDH